MCSGGPDEDLFNCNDPDNTCKSSTFNYLFIKRIFVESHNSYSKVFPNAGFAMEIPTVRTNLTNCIVVIILLTKSKVARMVSTVVINLPTCVWSGQR